MERIKYICAMGLWVPDPKNNKLGPLYWLRVLILLLFTIALTYYGKKPSHKPHIARHHGAVCWVMPTTRGLSALIVLPDDGNDTNQVSTGLRLWIAPPSQPERLEKDNHALYRGPVLAAVGDSLDLRAIEQLAAMIDTGGQLIVLGQSLWPLPMLSRAAGHLRFEQLPPDTGEFAWLAAWTGTDARLSLRFIPNPQNSARLLPQVDLIWNGYRARWWPTLQSALDDPVRDSLSAAILLECVPPETPVPHALNEKIRALIYCGERQDNADSTRIALDRPNAGAIWVEDVMHQRLLVKRVHLQWNAAEQ